MSLAQSTIVQRVRWLLGDNPWETTGETSSSTSSIFVADGNEWAKGNTGEFLDGDTFYVQSDPTGDELTCVRGYYGSTGATHGTGSRILKDPKFRFNEITNAVSAIINWELPWPRIYKVEAATAFAPVTVSHGAATGWYALPDDALGLVSVRQVSDTSPAELLNYGGFHNHYTIRFDRDLPTALVNTGVGIHFPAGFQDIDNSVYVNYAAKITDSVTTGAYDDLTAGDAVVEAIIFGAVALLSGALELRKGRHSATETNNALVSGSFARLFHSAVASAEKEIRQRTPLMKVHAK